MTWRRGLVCAALLAACHTAPAPTPPQPAAPAAAAAYAGTWGWEHRSASEGAYRVEREAWELAADGDRLTGSYRRRITVLATDGEPFACSQSLGYALDARYRLEGEVRGGRVDLREVDVVVTPSPCEPGRRPLGRYRGAAREDTLTLRFPGGVQTLRRGAVALPAAAGEAALDGHWRWTHRSRDEASGGLRVEREEWRLREGEHGALDGEIERVVTVFDPRGEPLPCAGAARYEVRDRYRLRGQRRGERVSLAEVGVDPGEHPCAGRQRHLGSARGRIAGGALVLTWRGDLVQVLERARE